RLKTNAAELSRRLDSGISPEILPAQKQILSDLQRLSDLLARGDERPGTPEPTAPDPTESPVPAPGQPGETPANASSSSDGGAPEQIAPSQQAISRQLGDAIWGHLPERERD